MGWSGWGDGVQCFLPILTVRFAGGRITFMSTAQATQTGIKSVTVDGFRGIRHGTLHDLTPLTVLVGPNGCGKSTILEAIQIASSVDRDSALKAFVEHRGRLDLGWVINVGSRKAKVEIELSNGSKVGAGFTIGPSDRPERLQFERVEGVQLAAGQQDVLFVDASVNDKKKHRHLQEMYTSAVKLGRRGYAQEIVRHIIEGATGIEILTEGGEPVIHIVFGDHSVPLPLVGDGIQRVLRIALELASIQAGTVLLEEPEVFQHPRAIRQTAKAILAGVRRGLQVIISTHSLEFIDALLEESTQEDLSQASVFRLVLQRGELKVSRLGGDDARFARKQIEDDLR